jgi:hypothetical protein
VVTPETTMGVFSGKYPKDLAKVIRHAKRMTDVLNEVERVRADAWFRGRASELRGIVALAVADWRSGALDAEGAGLDRGEPVDQPADGAGGMGGPPRDARPVYRRA